MLKEQYLTEENLYRKITHWKKKISQYSKRVKKFKLTNSALLIIDMQNYFLNERSHAYVPSSRVILKNIAQLLNLFRKKKLPIIFTYFAVKKNEKDTIKDWWNDTVNVGSSQSRIVEEIKPKEEEGVLRKRTYSSFYNTKLERFLKKHNVKNLLITGVLTNLCCETTAREAFVRNFNVFFVMDATATYNEEMHLFSLINLSYGFATLVSTEEIISKNDVDV